MRNTCKQTVFDKQRILFIFIHISIILGEGVSGQASENYDGKNHNVTNITKHNVETEQNLLQSTSVNDSSTSTGIIISYDPLVGFEKPKQSDVNLAFLPSFALILFIVLICLRICVWYREEFKYKSRGCSYDITSYVILSQGDDKFRNIDIKSDTNSYDTFNSISSFLRRNPQIHDTIHSIGSLQNRIDAKIYETVRSCTPILKKAHQSPDTELHSVPAGKRSRKTSANNSYTVSLDEKEIKIKDTRFRVVPALDNHLKHVSMRSSLNYKNRTSSQSERESQISVNSGPKTEQPGHDYNSEPGSPRSIRSDRTNKRIMVDAETQISTPLKTIRTSSRKRRKLKDTSSMTSSFESGSLGDSFSRTNEVESLTSTSISNSVSQHESYNQSNGKNDSELSELDEQLQYDKCSSSNANSLCALPNGDTDSRNIVSVKAMVHDQKNDYKDENTQTNSVYSHPLAEIPCLNTTNTNTENLDQRNVNGLVNKPLLRSALSYPSIVSNAFVESKNGNNNRTNGYINHHRYHSWNSEFSHKNVCTCLSTNSATNHCEMSKVQSTTCTVCYLNNHNVQSSVEFNNSRLENVGCDQKENRKENRKNPGKVSNVDGIFCSLNNMNNNSVVDETNFVDFNSMNYVNGDTFRIDIDNK